MLVAKKAYVQRTFTVLEMRTFKIEQLDKFFNRYNVLLSFMLYLLGLGVLLMSKL
jgi:hypothetical protein